MKKNKYVFVSAVITFLLIYLTPAYAATSTANKSLTVDKIIAIVNNEVITQSELDQQLSLLKEQLEHTNKTMPNQTELRHKILDGLIDTTLQLQLAKKNNIEIKDAELEHGLESLAKNNDMSVAKLKQSVIQTGMSWENFRQHVRTQMILGQLHQRVFANVIKVTPKDIEAALHTAPEVIPGTQDYHVEDILIPISDKPSAQQKKQVQDTALAIAQLLRQTPTTNAKQLLANFKGAIKPEINDLGWSKLTNLPNLFEPAIARMKSGEISDPIEAPNGLHVLKLVETRGGKQIQISKKQAEEVAYQRKLEEKLKPWLQEIRTNAYIKIMD